MRLKTCLLRKEIINPTQSQDLWKLTSIPKRVREPGFAAEGSKSALEVLLPVQILADKRLPRGYHTVVFEPCSTDRSKLAFRNILGDPLEGLRIILLQPDVVLGGRGSELIIREAIHKVTLRAPASSNFLVCLRVSPQPGGIDVAIQVNSMPHHAPTNDQLPRAWHLEYMRGCTLSSLELPLHRAYPEHFGRFVDIRVSLAPTSHLAHLRFVW